MNVPNATQAHNRLIECIQKDHDVATVESTPVSRQRQSASLQRKSQALNIINFATRTAGTPIFVTCTIETVQRTASTHSLVLQIPTTTAMSSTSLSLGATIVLVLRTPNTDQPKMFTLNDVRWTVDEIQQQFDGTDMFALRLHVSSAGSNSTFAPSTTNTFQVHHVPTWTPVNGPNKIVHLNGGLHQIIMNTPSPRPFCAGQFIATWPGGVHDAAEDDANQCLWRVLYQESSRTVRVVRWCDFTFHFFFIFFGCYNHFH
jgi:hypothetical protein